MAESPEGSRLSGLARSIDALFSPPEAAASATASASSRDAPVVPAAASPDDAPLAADMFPATQAFDALPETPAGPPDVVPPAADPSAGTSENDFDPLLSFESDWSEPFAGEAVLEVAAESAPSETETDPPESPPESIRTETPAPPADVAEPPFVGEAAPERSAPGPLAEPSPHIVRDEAVRAGPTASDAEGFLAAVDAWVDGDHEQRDRVETLAEALRDRLALDPLSDGVEKLVRAAGDPPDRTYLALATKVMNPAVASRLVQRMGRERDEARREEYQNLCRRLGVLMANALKGALTGKLDDPVRRLYCDTLISMGPVSRPIIEAMVEDDNRFLVRDAVMMVGEMGGERAVELVTSALANTDPRVRAEALHALGELGDEDAGRLTLGFLDDPDSSVRVAAAVAAGKLGLERALRPLLQLLEQEDETDKRVRLLEALGDLGDPGAVPAIEKHAAPGLFAKSSTDVRVAAYKALHRIGTPHARELVERAMSDKEHAVRAALRGLTREA